METVDWTGIGIGSILGVWAAMYLTDKRREKAMKTNHNDVCPKCGAESACYSCVTQGGWRSRKEEEEYEREQALERTP